MITSSKESSTEEESNRKPVKHDHPKTPYIFNGKNNLPLSSTLVNVVRKNIM